MFKKFITLFLTLTLALPSLATDPRASEDETIPAPPANEEGVVNDQPVIKLPPITSGGGANNTDNKNDNKDLPTTRPGRPRPGRLGGFITPDISDPVAGGATNNNNTATNNNSNRNNSNRNNNRGNGKNIDPFMIGTDPSMVPDVTCPLVDNRPHANLVAAADNLFNNVKAFRGCKDNSDIETLEATVASIASAGKNLQNMGQQPLTETGNLRAAEKELETIISGIDTFSQSLANNSLISDDCGKDKMKGSNILVALSDLVHATAPTALKIASANPEFAPAIPFIMGLSGAGSVVKVIKKMHDESTLDMNNSLNRQAVLLNICEFSRINTRVKIFKRAKSGDLRAATEDLEKFSAIRKTFASNISSRVLEILDVRTKIQVDLESSQKDSAADLKELKEIRSQVDKQEDKTIACFVARELVANSGVESKLPLRAINNFHKVINNQEKITLTQNALLKVESTLRGLIAWDADKYEKADIERCAELGLSYVESMVRLVEGTQTSIQSLKVSVDEAMEKDAEVSTVLKVENSIKAETQKIETITRSGQLTKYLNADNGMLDIREIDEQLTDIKRAIFEKAPKLFGKSALLAWLDHADEQVRINHKAFRDEMAKLKTQIYFDHTKAGEAIHKGLSPFNPAINYRQDQIDSKQLIPLTVELLKEGSENHRQVCSRIEDIWFLWYSVVNNLGAQEFVCNSVSPYLQTGKVELPLQQRCTGWTNLAGGTKIASDIQNMRTTLSKDSGQDAILINNKYNELRCSQFE